MFCSFKALSMELFIMNLRSINYKLYVVSTVLL